MAEPFSESTTGAACTKEEKAISLVSEVIGKFQLTDLQPLLTAVERQARSNYLNVAVFGRFKAGKSSFLNHLLGRPILPVGVVPVTTVITELCYAPEESVEVIYQRDRKPVQVRLCEIAAYTSESENPANRLGVDMVRVFVPEMAPYLQLRLIDTPGLESILAHNTEASFAWSPNTDLAVVAIGVDPPLTQHDVALIERLRQFTPNIYVLLTKMDLLNPAEQREVFAFVTTQLAAKFPGGLPVFPFSIKSGCEELQNRFKEEVLFKTLSSFQQDHSAALVRKLQTLLASASDYLRLALKSAEAHKQDHDQLRQDVLGPQSSLDDTDLQFRLLAQHAAAATRPVIDRYLQQAVRSRLEKTLEERLLVELPRWCGSFANLLSQFEQWLRHELESELSRVSAAESSAFLEPLQDMQRQCQRILQSFRNHLSERVMRVFGVPLHTTETEIELQPPCAPDIHLSRIFDHNWELLSAIIPVFLVRGLLKQRFAEKVESEVFKNLSRLTSQWEETIRAAIHSAEKEAHRRFHELIHTVQGLLSNEDPERIDALREWLEKLQIEAERLSLPRNKPV
jgi:GTP-binding protein EngB required for normal cell division